MSDLTSCNISFGLATHVGGERTINQDSAGAWVSPYGGAIRGVFVLADGMGGGHAGEEASQLAVRYLLEQFSTWSGDVSRDRLLCEMKAAVADLNREIYNLSRARHVNQIGTTVDLIVITADAVCCVHVGDGQICQLDSFSGQQITEDHSALGDLLKRGVPYEAAVEAVGGNQVTHMVGTGGAVDPRIDPLHLDAVSGLTLAICCDGVHGGMEKQPPLCVGFGDLASAVVSTPSLQDAAESVVGTAVKRDGSDNATCLLLRIEPPGTPAGHPPGYQAGDIVQLPGGPVGDLSNQPIGGRSRAATQGVIGSSHSPFPGSTKREFSVLLTTFAVAAVIILISTIAMLLQWRTKKDNNQSTETTTKVLQQDLTGGSPGDNDATGNEGEEREQYLPQLNEDEAETFIEDHFLYLYNNNNTTNFIPQLLDPAHLRECGQLNCNPVMALAKAAVAWNRAFDEDQTGGPIDWNLRATTFNDYKKNFYSYEDDAERMHFATQNCVTILEYKLLRDCVTIPPEDRRGKAPTFPSREKGIAIWEQVRGLILSLNHLSALYDETSSLSLRLEAWKLIWRGDPSGIITRGSAMQRMELASQTPAIWNVRSVEPENQLIKSRNDAAKLLDTAEKVYDEIVGEASDVKLIQ